MSTIAVPHQKYLNFNPVPEIVPYCTVCTGYREIGCTCLRHVGPQPSLATLLPMRQSPDPMACGAVYFWHVYNYVAKNWYETEYGVNGAGNWYHDAMIFLEHLRDTWRFGR